MLFLPQDAENVEYTEEEMDVVDSFFDLAEHFADNIGLSPSPMAGMIWAGQLLDDYEKTDEVETSYGGGH